MLPWSVVVLSRRTVPLDVLPIKIDHADRKLGILTATDRQGPPAVRQFAGFLIGEFQRLRARMKHEQQLTRSRG